MACGGRRRLWLGPKGPTGGLTIDVDPRAQAGHPARDFGGRQSHVGVAEDPDSIQVDLLGEGFAAPDPIPQSGHDRLDVGHPLFDLGSDLSSEGRRPFSRLRRALFGDRAVGQLDRGHLKGMIDANDHISMASEILGERGIEANVGVITR